MPNPRPVLPRVIYDATALRQATGQCDCSDDCACAESALAESAGGLPPLAQFPGKLRRAPASAALPLAEGQAVYFGPFHFPTVLNQPAQDLLAEYAVGQPARWADQADRHALEQLWQARLLIPADQPEPSLNVPVPALAAWVHLTDQCNFCCDYCYVPHRGRAMSAATGQAVVEATLRSARAHGYQRVKFKYAGGEPLLALGPLTEFHRYAQQRGDQAQVTVEGVVLSNGTLLTPAVVRALQALGLRLMISLDGLGAAHDAQRPYANGAASFGDVARGIALARAEGLTPDISITVSGRNAANLPELVAWVLDQDLPFSLNLYRENDCSAAHAALKLGDEQLIESLLAAYQVIERQLPRRSLLGALADRANLSRPHRRTCGAGEDYLAYDCDGRAAKCQMQLEAPVTSAQVPDPLGRLRADLGGLQNLPVDEKDGCRACEWKYWCGGGCPLVTYRATGRYDVPSPNCQLYRTIYPAVMRLEGLRLLKYGVRAAR